MSRNDHTYRPRADGRGIYINGWRVSWYVVVTVFLVIGNAAVAQYRIEQLESRLGTIAEDARKVRVIDNRITNNTETIRWHRVHEHGDKRTNPGRITQ